MKKLIAVTATALLVAGISTSSASAKHRRHHVRASQSEMITGTSPMRGNNAELRGNNGNSASGSNSLGHIQGGDIGGGK
jgi:hypothetical protein